LKKSSKKLYLFGAGTDRRFVAGSPCCPGGYESQLLPLAKLLEILHCGILPAVDGLLDAQGYQPDRYEKDRNATDQCP
jgi:hypothetical protein